MWNRIKDIVHTYAYVVLGVEISTATFISIFYPDSVFSIALLWQVLICSFICTLGNLLWWTERQLSRIETVIRIFLHYLYINVIVFGTAFVFDWIDRNSPIMLISMFFMILIVFIAVFLVTWYYEKRTTEQMNKGLKAYQRQDADE